MISPAGRRHRHSITPQCGQIFRHHQSTAECIVRYCLLALLLLGVAPAHAADEAPDFTLKSLQGENLRLKDYRGSVVILSFITGRCRNCEQQLRALDELHKRYNPVGLQVLGISADLTNERAAALREELKLGFPILLDKDKQTTQQYQATLMPALVVVDKDGRQRYLHQNSTDADVQAYEAELRQLLNEWQ